MLVGLRRWETAAKEKRGRGRRERKRQRAREKSWAIHDGLGPVHGMFYLSTVASRAVRVRAALSSCSERWVGRVPGGGNSSCWAQVSVKWSASVLWGFQRRDSSGSFLALKIVENSDETQLLQHRNDTLR